MSFLSPLSIWNNCISIDHPPFSLPGKAPFCTERTVPVQRADGVCPGVWCPWAPGCSSCCWFHLQYVYIYIYIYVYMFHFSEKLVSWSSFSHRPYPIFSHCWSQVRHLTQLLEMLFLLGWPIGRLSFGGPWHVILCNLGGSLEDTHRFINHINLDGISPETGEQVWINRRGCWLQNRSRWCTSGTVLGPEF